MNYNYAMLCGYNDKTGHKLARWLTSSDELNVWNILLYFTLNWNTKKMLIKFTLRGQKIINIEFLKKIYKSIERKQIETQKHFVNKYYMSIDNFFIRIFPVLPWSPFNLSNNPSYISYSYSYSISFTHPLLYIAL